MDKDSQDHNNMQATPGGNESHAVHLCRQCGWPFPNPHPSARHRRAHKKVCGAIEGYKRDGSASEDHSVSVTVSDDDNLSDDDRKTPSPKLTEKSNNGKNSAGIGERSNRSEDDVFSDAVTEFPESGFTPGIEERPNDAKVAATDVEKSVEKDFTMFYSFTDNAFADIIEASSNSSDSSQMQNPEVPEKNATALSQINPESQVHASSSTEESSAILTGDKSQLACDFQAVEPETPMHVSQENNVMNPYDGVRDCSMTCVGQKIGAKGNDEVNSESNVVPLSASEYSGQTSKVQSKCQEIEKMTSDRLSAAEVVLLDEHGAEIASKMSSGDPIPRLESVGLSDATDTAQTKVGVEQGLDLFFSNPMQGFSGKGEGNENAHEISVLADIPVVDHAETMLKDFKDYKGVKVQQPVTLDSAETIKEKKVDVGDPVSVEDHASVQTMQLIEVSKVSTSDMHVEEDDHVVGNSSAEVENDESEVKLTNNEGSDESGAPSVAAAIRMEQSNPVSSMEKQHSDVSDDLLHVCAQETAVMVSHDVNPTVASSDTNIIGLHDAENHKNLASEMCDTGNEEKERVKEEDYAENKITNSDSATNLPEFHVNPVISLYESDDAGDREEVKIEKRVAVGVESKEETSEEKLLLETKTAFESDGNLPESRAIDEDAMDVSMMNSTEAKLTNINEVSVIPDISKQPEVKGNDKAQGEFNAEHCRNIDSLERTSEDQATKASFPLPSDAESSMQHSVDDNYAREHGTGHSGIDQSSQGENNSNNFVKHQFGASAVDVSVDSSSQADSLEGNWGSVSVLSTQSDVPAVVDAETLASAEAEKLNSKKIVCATERQHSDKSDIFEAPSFMTLVEPGGGSDQKAAASDIETIQNLEQKQAPSQAGWFPSLTHVVNESQGRKKNEEMIAKVTNWSTGKQHTPLKNLLGEANLESKPRSPNPRDNKAPPVIQKDEKVAKENNAFVTTVGSILGPEVPAPESANRETGKEVNSPARYPADIKREKRKVKGRPYWVQFVCCSSVN